MSEISQFDFDYIRELVYHESAIAIEPDMLYLVESRLLSLVRKSEFPDIGALVASLRSSDDLALSNQIVEAMTTNETSFFRDNHPFEALCKEVLPEIAKSHDEPITIWCAACSTGQEVYTIAMSVHEHCPHLIPRISLVGTDFSSEVVARARAGQYSRLEVNRGLPMQLLTRYFIQKGLSWEVVPVIKEMASFNTLNLIADWGSMPAMDIIFLRNVLIYFDPDVKSKVLNKTIEVLKPGGSLFLGLSETTLNLNTDYRRVTTDNSHYYKVAA